MSTLFLKEDNYITSIISTKITIDSDMIFYVYTYIYTYIVHLHYILYNKGRNYLNIFMLIYLKDTSLPKMAWMLYSKIE